jgi:secondary thiamine-phosphate synthase enzyme
MYEITDDVNAWIKKEEISGGQLTIFIKHTSASLCIQENASRDVLEDIDNFLKKLVPENPTLYRHNIEGKDDMPAHIKSMLTQTSLTVPVRDKKMNLGTWQGIFLLEHRINSIQRKINLTLIGE